MQWSTCYQPHQHLFLQDGSWANLQSVRIHRHLGMSDYRCSRTRLCRCIASPYRGSAWCGRLPVQLGRRLCRNRTKYVLLTYLIPEGVRRVHRWCRLLPVSRFNLEEPVVDLLFHKSPHAFSSSGVGLPLYGLG